MLVERKRVHKVLRTVSHHKEEGISVHHPGHPLQQQKSLTVLPSQPCFCREDSKPPVRWCLSLNSQRPVSLSPEVPPCDKRVLSPSPAPALLPSREAQQGTPRLCGVAEVQGEAFQTGSCIHRVSCLPAVSFSTSQPRDLLIGNFPICFL